MKKNIFLILMLGCIAANAQAPRKFYTRFGGYGHDIGYGVIQTLNGQYAVTGSTSSFGNGNTDVYLALIDSMGWVRWEKSFGGFNNDIGKSIIQLKDSGFVMAGYTNSFGSGGYDMFVVRTDKNGNLIWQKTFGGIDWDFAYCVKESNGRDSLIIAGSTYSYGYGKQDGYIVKTDLNGTLQWSKTFGGPEDDEFKSFTLTYNNQYAFAGTTKSMGDVKGDCWIQKTSLNGDSILGIKYGDSKKQSINKIIETTSKDLLMCGANDSTGTDSTWSYFICVNENGILNYRQSFSKHCIQDQQFMTVVNSKNNDFVYIEKEYNSPVGFKLEPTICVFTGPYYNTCNTYGSTSDEILYEIANTKDRGTIAVGYTNGFNANLSDVFLVKMDSTIHGSVKIVGIEETNGNYNTNNIINVFPTITNSSVHIQMNNNLIKPSIKVYNALGYQIIDEVITNGYHSIELESFEDGIYFIQIADLSLRRTFKVIKLESR